jgi:hypothetical protein
MNGKGVFSVALLAAAVVATSCGENGSTGGSAADAGVCTTCPDAMAEAGTDSSVDAATDAAIDAACVAETDAAFCARLGKSCENVTSPDNCGTVRTATCGACSGSTPACVDNVCKAPVCGTNYGGTGTTVTTLSVMGAGGQGLLGVSATGASILYLQPAAGCYAAGDPLILADAATAAFPAPPAYTQKQNINAVPNLAAFSKLQQSMTLTPDGLTIIGAGMANNSFLSSRRSALFLTDFTPAVAGELATLNAAIPAGASVAYPVRSADGLAFYYQVTGATTASDNGIYEALRAQTTVPFAAGQKMPANVQAFEAVTGVSSDRMTLFVTAGFATSLLSRTSVFQPFVASGATGPTQAFRVVPLAGCSALLGTCEPGGCAAETICVWTRH